GGQLGYHVGVSVGMVMSKGFFGVGTDARVFVALFDVFRMCQLVGHGCDQLFSLLVGQLGWRVAVRGQLVQVLHDLGALLGRQLVDFGQVVLKLGSLLRAERRLEPVHIFEYLFAFFANRLARGLYVSHRVGFLDGRVGRLTTFFGGFWPMTALLGSSIARSCLGCIHPLEQLLSTCYDRLQPVNQRLAVATAPAVRVLSLEDVGAGGRIQLHQLVADLRDRSAVVNAEVNSRQAHRTVGVVVF